MKKDKTLKELRAWAKRKKVGRLSYKKIVQIQKKKTASRPEHFWADLLEESLHTEGDPSIKEDIYQKNKKGLEKSKKIKNRIWRLLVQLGISLNTANSAWTRQLTREIISSGPGEVFFYRRQVKRITNEKAAELFYRLLKKYRSKIKDKLLLQMLASKLFEIGNSIEFKIIKSEFDIGWSLAELRNIATRGKHTNQYFDFWYDKIVNRTSDHEELSLLKKMLTPRSLKKAALTQLWVFKYYLPKSKVLRKILFSRLEKAWKEGDDYSRFIVLQCIKQSPIKRALSLKIPEFKRALFQIERDYFRGLLEKGGPVHFSLAHLIWLGDKNVSDLWWIVL